MRVRRGNGKYTANTAAPLAPPSRCTTRLDDDGDGDCDALHSPPALAPCGLLGRPYLKRPKQRKNSARLFDLKLLLPLLPMLLLP